jgi:hypothetical protein
MFLAFGDSLPCLGQTLPVIASNMRVDTSNKM